MDDKKEETGFWKGWMTIVVLLGTVIIVLWFNSYDPTVRPGPDENISVDNRTRVPIENSADVQIGNGDVAPMDDDTFFRTWVAVSFKTINDNLDCISKASKVRNLVAVEACGKLLSDDSNMSLRDIDKHGANTSMKTVLDEYKKSLEDYYIGGTDLEIGARNGNGSQMAVAIGYIQNGTVHVKLVGKMLSGNDTTGEKFAYQNGVNDTN